jgi:apolipoprotein N-acyltransferase
MPHRRTWPRGLRAIYWFSVAGLTVGVAQIFYWLFVNQEFFPRLTLQGGYAIAALALGAFCVIAGALGRRRAFAVSALIATAFHLCVLGYFSFETLRYWLPDVVAGRSSLLQDWQAYAGVNAWNSFVALGNVLVAYYLLRHEFRFFGARTV